MPFLALVAEGQRAKLNQMASGRVSAHERLFRERDCAPNPVASDLARLVGRGSSRVSDVAHFDVSHDGARESAP
jgi:hypothetical protein